MKKAVILASALIALSASAQAASLTGKWSGKGAAVDHQGKTIACESVVLTITQTASALSVGSDFTCEGQKFSFPGNVEIRGHELFDKGMKAGTISATALALTIKDRNFILQSNASFTDNAMNLRAVVSVASNPAKPVLKFESALKR